MAGGLRPSRDGEFLRCRLSARGQARKVDAAGVEAGHGKQWGGEPSEDAEAPVFAIADAQGRCGGFLPALQRTAAGDLGADTPSDGQLQRALVRSAENLAVRTDKNRGLQPLDLVPAGLAHNRDFNLRVGGLESLNGDLLAVVLNP